MGSNLKLFNYATDGKVHMNHKALIENACAYSMTIDWERDPWEKAPVLTAMLRSGAPAQVSAARRTLDRVVATQTTAGQLSYSEPVRLSEGHIPVVTPSAVASSLGYCLLLSDALQQNSNYVEASVTQYDSTMSMPKTRDGGITGRLENIELWIDFTYMLCPFMALLGKRTNDPTRVDEAFKQFEVHVAHLVDPATSLPRHTWIETPNSFGQSTLWSRGIGWLLCAAVDLLEIAPDHPRSNAVAATFRNAVVALVPLQDRSGYWHNVVDDTTQPLEASGTLMHSYAIAKGIRIGLLDTGYLDVSRRGFQVVAGGLHDDGAVPGVALPPGGPDVSLGSAAFGQGFFMQAAQELGLAND